jgi:hypothetical protein
MNYSWNMQMGQTAGLIYPSVNRILIGGQSKLLTEISVARHNAHCGGSRVSGEQGESLYLKEIASEMLELDGISGAFISAPKI